MLPLESALLWLLVFLHISPTSPIQYSVSCFPHFLLYTHHHCSNLIKWYTHKTAFSYLQITATKSHGEKNPHTINGFFFCGLWQQEPLPGFCHSNTQQCFLDFVVLMVSTATMTPGVKFSPKVLVLFNVDHPLVSLSFIPSTFQFILPGFISHR